MRSTRNGRAGAALGVAIALGSLLAAAAVAQQNPRGTEPVAGSPSAQPKVDPETQAWNAVSRPGDHHTELSRMRGYWEVKATFFAPGEEPVVAWGESENELTLGNRFLRSMFTSRIAGQYYEARGLEGYDSAKKVHTAAWADNQGTSMHLFEGDCNAAHDVITTYSYQLDPLSGKTKTVTGVTKLKSATEYSYEQWEQKEGTESFRVMELVFTKP